MSCTLTVVFNTPGYNNGTDTANFSVPDKTYKTPYIVTRPELGYNGSTNNVYSLDCNGSQGIIRLGTFYPGSIQVSVQSASNSCDTSYDCINGACFLSSVYNTPGFYNSLEECQVNCGKGCSGVCIANSDWQKIEVLAAQLKNQNCS